MVRVARPAAQRVRAPEDRQVPLGRPAEVLRTRRSSPRSGRGRRRSAGRACGGLLSPFPSTPITNSPAGIEDHGRVARAAGAPAERSEPGPASASRQPSARRSSCKDRSSAYPPFRRLYHPRRPAARRPAPALTSTRTDPNVLGPPSTREAPSSGGVAQLVEQENHNLCVRGSSPCAATTFTPHSRACAGSSPSCAAPCAASARPRAGRPRAPAPRPPLLVAVSGGADSTALLLGLRPSPAELGLELHAAHLHHGLRGAEADADLALRARAVRAAGRAARRRALGHARAHAAARALRPGRAAHPAARVPARGRAPRRGARRSSPPTRPTTSSRRCSCGWAAAPGSPGLAGMRPAVPARRSRAATAALAQAAPRRDPGRDRGRPRPGRPALARGPLEPRPALHAQPRAPRGGPRAGRALLPRPRPGPRARELLALRAARATAAARVAARALGAPCRARARPGGPRPARDGHARGRAAGAGLPTGAEARRPRPVLAADAGPRSTGLTDRHLAALDGLIDTGRAGAPLSSFPGGGRRSATADVIRLRRAEHRERASRGPPPAPGPARVGRGAHRGALDHRSGGAAAPGGGPRHGRVLRRR